MQLFDTAALLPILARRLFLSILVLILSIVSKIIRALMRFFPLLLVLLVWLVSGCSHTYHVTFSNDNPKGDTVAVGTLNRRLADRSAKVIPRNGEEFAVSDVLLTRDSCLFISDSGRGHIPTSKVFSINRVDHFSGAIGGFGWGIGSGLVVGYGVAKMAQASSGDKLSGMTGVIPMVLAPVIGLVVGAVIGTKTEYQLPQASPDSTVRHTEGRLPHNFGHGTPGSGAKGN